jgi:hypothetical protein
LSKLHNKDDQLDDNLNKTNIQTAVISETNKKLRGTKETKNYIHIYSGITKQTRTHAGVMIN